ILALSGIGALAQDVQPGIVGVPRTSDVLNFSKLPQLQPGESAPARRPRLRHQHVQPSNDSLPLPSASTTPPIPKRQVFGARTAGAVAPGGAIQITPAGTSPSPPPSASFQAILDNGTAFNPDTQG